MNGGYGIHFNRADQNYPSGVTLSDNGVNIASTNSSFQFGYSLTINYVVFNPDGSVQGRITGDGNTFDFSFPARTINSQGNNISINIPDGTACPNGIVSTVDNFKIAQAPTIISTNRTPLNSAIGSPTIPTDPTHFKVFTNGIFTNGIPLDPSKMTVVMTHGLNGSPSDWAEYMAQIIRQRIGANTVNLVAWDWSAEAHTNVWDVGIIARKNARAGICFGNKSYCRAWRKLFATNSFRWS